jgi:Fe-S-cluster-containing dehydrogenase component
VNAPAAIEVVPAACTACRACELACHYHHSGTFGTSRASIRIDLDADSGALRLEFDASCDGCAGESVPLCVRFCAPGALHLRA